MENIIYTYNFIQNKKLDTDISDKIDIDTDGYWCDTLKNFDRLFYNNDHKETRRHSSYEKIAKFGNMLILCWGNNNPEITLIKKEYDIAKRKAFFDLYDRILRSLKFLTQKQFIAFELRALCCMPFKDIAYHMRFECQMNENEQSAKRHYYNAVRKIRKRFMKDYINMKNSLANF